MLTNSTRHLHRWLLIVFCASTIVSTRPAAAATISVGCGDTRVAELIAAIEQANTTPAADTIELAVDCVYTLTAVHNTIQHQGANGLPVISTPLTINGNGAVIERSTAADTPAFRLLMAQADLTLHQLTLHNGNADTYNNGGAILNIDSNLMISESTLWSNTAHYGGGIYNHAGQITIHHTTFSHNTAGFGGAIQSDLGRSGIPSSSHIIITQSIFSYNSVEDDGGAISNNGPLTVTHTTFSHNSALWNGGAVSNNGPLTVNHSTFSYNTTDKDGGAISSHDPLTVTHSTFSHNTAALGGAINSYDLRTIEHSTFRHNTAGAGGALFVFSEPTGLITNSDFSQNSAVLGGAILNSGYLHIQHSTFRNNTASWRGGAIENEDTLTIHHSTISRNAAYGDFGSGGGINMTDAGSLQLIDSTVSDNRAIDGGGIYCACHEFIIQGSTIRGNRATNQGGGIWNLALPFTVHASTINGNQATDGGGIWNDGVFEIHNSTVSGNTATNQGGGILSNGGLEVHNSTITRNQATDGGGIWQMIELTLAQTIVANNTAATGSDIALHSDSTTNHESISQGHNFIGSNATVDAVFPAGTPNSNGDYVGTPAAPLAPRLGRLSDNGGPTLTHMPVHDSLVINTGAITSTFTTDQRGFTRIYGPRVDIGAVETSPSAFLHPTHVIEGSPAVFTVRLAMPLTQTVTIDYATSDGTAQAPQDYTATSGTVTFAPGTTEAVVLVPVPADAIAEASETFTLTLSSPSGVLLGTSSATATIVEAQARLYLPLVRTPAPAQYRTGQ